MNNYGIQLYSVRDAMEKDVAGTLQKLADLGYKYVEFAGFFGYAAEEIKEMLDRTGLICSGAHTPWTDLLPENIAETVKYHKAIGNPNIIVPGADLSTYEKVVELCEVMKNAQIILEAEGIRLGYHNHAHEFKVNPWGSTSHGEIERRTGVDFEIDVFWIFEAGLDTIAVLERLKDRIRVIHLKDGFRGGEGNPLGQGEVPIKEIIDYAVLQGWTMVVESETVSPSGMDEATACIEYLKSIG